MTDYQADKFVIAFGERFPARKSEVDKHIEENRGEILAHIFFLENITGRFLELARDGSEASVNELREILQFLEDSYLEGDEYECWRNVIKVSFLEFLQDEGETTNRIVSMFGPRLAAAWQEHDFY